MTDAEIVAIRARARSWADLLGAPPDAVAAAAAPAGEGVWLYSDTSFDHFGLQVPDDLVRGTVTEDAVGLTTGTLADGTAV